jgi:mono/diheme cytochrome c family protein
VHVNCAEMHARFAIAVLAVLGVLNGEALTAHKDRSVEAANPVRPLPKPPLGVDGLDDLPSPPAAERVRLGRWLFFDTRLSADGTVSCATCHVPERAFSNGTRFALGVGGHVGARKTPSFVNTAHAFVRNRFGWDGRAASLEEQSLLPVANPAEMGSTPARMVGTLSRIAGYAPYFQQAFGDSATRSAAVATTGRTSPIARFTTSDSAGMRRRSATRTKGAPRLRADRPIKAPSRPRRCATSHGIRRTCTTGRCRLCERSFCSTNEVASGIRISTRRSVRSRFPVTMSTRWLISSVR